MEFPHSPIAGAPPRILMVEDDVIVREIMSAQLAAEGFSVIQADDVASARAVIAAESIDLAVVDINLPDGTGFEFVEALRAVQEIAVIYMTTRGGARDRVHGLNIGGDDYVVKPVDLAELKARIRAVLRRYSRERP